MLIVENCICLLTAYFFKQLLQLSLSLSILSCNAGDIYTAVWKHAAMVMQLAEGRKLARILTVFNLF